MTQNDLWNEAGPNREVGSTYIFLYGKLKSDVSRSLKEEDQESVPINIIPLTRERRTGREMLREEDGWLPIF